MGVRMAIATNASEEAGRAYLRSRGISDEHIPVIVGKESFGDKSKPHPYILNAALHNIHFKEPFPTVARAKQKRVNVDSQDAYKHLKGLKEGVVYVGEAPDDVVAAKKAGMVSIAITEGMGREKDLRKAGPDFVFRNAAELVEHIEKHDEYLVKGK